MSDFKFDYRHFRDLGAFKNHLITHDPRLCNWVRRIIIHHTVSPTTAGWAGVASVRGAMRYYRDTLGWDGAPHLFVCAGAKDPDDDGVFQLNPLNLRGIHSNNCNIDGIAIEVVGNYDKVAWSPAMKALVEGTTAFLMQWIGLEVTPQTLVGHRDCGSTKTCPGKMINMDVVRADVARLMS